MKFGSKPLRSGRTRLLAALGSAALIAGGFVVSAGSASAAVDDDAVVTWSVRPADESGPDGRSWVELEADPGTTSTEHLAVRNLSDVEVTFSITGADGYFTPTGRFNMLASDQESVDAGIWIDVADAVTVPAGETQIVPFTITVPADATPGDHAAGIAASIYAESADSGATVGVESRVGFRVMVRVAGEIEPSLRVDAWGDYSIEWNPFDPGAIALTYTLENAGNVRMSVFGAAEWADQQIPDQSSDAAAESELLPRDLRTFSLQIPRVWPLGPISVPLTIEQSVIMPDGTVERLDPIVQSVTVWAMPWPQLIVVAAIVLLLVGLFWGRRRRKLNVERLLDEAREQGRREAHVDA